FVHIGNVVMNHRLLLRFLVTLSVGVSRVVLHSFVYGTRKNAVTHAQVGLELIQVRDNQVHWNLCQTRLLDTVLNSPLERVRVNSRYSLIEDWMVAKLLPSYCDGLLNSSPGLINQTEVVYCVHHRGLEQVFNSTDPILLEGAINLGIIRRF